MSGPQYHMLSHVQDGKDMCCGCRLCNSLSYIIIHHTGLASVGEQLASRRIAIFGHTARLGKEVPAHQALRAHVNLSLGRLPGRDWKRRPGRPNNRWVDQIRNDTGNIPSTLWRSDILRGHGTGVTQWPSPATWT